MTNEFLGYSEFFEVQRKVLGFNECLVARVTSEHKEAYRVRNENGEYFAKVTGTHMYKATNREEYPAVGDWVLVTVPDEEHAVIHAILPRRTMLKRVHGDKDRSGGKSDVQVIAANIDVAFVVESVDRDYSLNRFERYIAIAEQGGVLPVIVLNKIDLLSQDEVEEKRAEIRKRFPDTEMVFSSIVRERGLDELLAHVEKGKTYCFLGSSGVGKSSLINTLIGDVHIRTSGVSERSGRGVHTTTSRHMYVLENGGIVVDNPGVREVGVTDVSGYVEDTLSKVAPEKKCKYSDCTHTHEPGCVVRDAVERGEVDKDQYAQYVDLKRESEYYDMSERDKRGRDKAFGKFMKSAKKDIKRFKGR